MAFEVFLHQSENIVEVIYPPEPTAEDVADYVAKIKALIDGLQGSWCCLVDQRQLQSEMAPELYKQVTVLNEYAQVRGMRRAARLVSTDTANRQVSQLGREVLVDTPIQTFTSREKAVNWLKAHSDPPPPPDAWR